LGKLDERNKIAKTERSIDVERVNPAPGHVGFYWHLNNTAPHTTAAGEGTSGLVNTIVSEPIQESREDRLVRLGLQQMLKIVNTLLKPYKLNPMLRLYTSLALKAVDSPVSYDDLLTIEEHEIPDGVRSKLEGWLRKDGRAQKFIAFLGDLEGVWGKYKWHEIGSRLNAIKETFEDWFKSNKVTYHPHTACELSEEVMMELATAIDLSYRVNPIRVTDTLDTFLVQNKILTSPSAMVEWALNYKPEVKKANVGEAVSSFIAALLNWCAENPQVVVGALRALMNLLSGLLTKEDAPGRTTLRDEFAKSEFNIRLPD